MKTPCLSTFTPSMMPPEALEAVFVQREALAARIVELIRESAAGRNKHHTILIGPRGIGKTHIVSLVYHRIRAAEGLREKLLIAWLREEEYGITAVRDVFMRLLLVLSEEYADPGLKARVEALYKLDSDAAEQQAGRMLKEYVGSRTLLVLTENLDQTFEGLGDIGQQRLRSYIQQNPFFTILGTAQSLFGGVRVQTSPFYGFFSIQHLQELTFEEATELLAKIAELRPDPALAEFIRTPAGRARIRAVHHLGGGNHRVYAIFSEVLSCNSPDACNLLDALVDAVMQMLEKLTPYYQSRMAQLSPQQRKVVEFLCERRGAAPVKEIAERCFATSQTVSGQLQGLRDMGYVHATQVGRESYYELREPLMRICIEVKKQRGEPVRLLVEFLRIWYSQDELKDRLGGLDPKSHIDRQYLTAALRACLESAEDPCLAACEVDMRRHIEAGDFEQALKVAHEAVCARPDALTWLNYALILQQVNRLDEALIALDKSTTFPERYVSSVASILRAAILERLGRHGESLATLDRVPELSAEAMAGGGEVPVEVLALAWFTRSLALIALDRRTEGATSITKALDLSPNDAAIAVMAGTVLGQQGMYEEAVRVLGRAVELDAASEKAWFCLGMAHASLKQHEKALIAIGEVLRLNPKNIEAFTYSALVLRDLRRYSEAIETYDKAIAIDGKAPAPWFGRAATLVESGQWQAGLQTLNTALGAFPGEEKNVRRSAKEILGEIWRDVLLGGDAGAALSDLFGLFEKRQATPHLAAAFLDITKEAFPDIPQSLAALEAWLAAWQKVVADKDEFKMPLRLLGAAVRYLAAEKRDERILLELPEEERRLVYSLLGRDEAGKNT
jgi:tetratricopeptide (TPR) repeat protein